MKNLTTSKKLVLVGGAGAILLNPLSVNILGDFAVVAINQLVRWLVVSSTYTMAVSGTLIAVGLFIAYEARKSSEVKRLKKLKSKKTQTAGEFIQ